MSMVGKISSRRADSSTDIELDDVFVGRYQIEKCRHRTQGIASALDRAIAALRPALEDVKLGIDSTHGFRAFFKYDGAKQYVEDMLTQISHLDKRVGLLPSPTIPVGPRFACLSEHTRRSFPWLGPYTDPWTICQTSVATALYILGTAYIWLCPRFFDQPTKPQDLTGRDCPIVVNNAFRGEERRFMGYQNYILIHEMVHFYLQSKSLTGTTMPTEAYGFDSLLELLPLDALHNPTSYQAYVASTYLPVSHSINHMLLEFLH